MMREKLTDNITKAKLFSKNQRILIAFSGGCDSTALSDFLFREGYNIHLAHCNYRLRGNESTEDERFCREWANTRKIPFHVKKFDTKKISKSKKKGIQETARQLRYDWFSELMSENSYDVLLTGHHLQDEMENFFIRLLRGSGLKGLKGMRMKEGHLLRPLLNISKKEIEDYCVERKIKYRKDSSNSDEKYLRNFIRKKILPLMFEAEVSFGKVFSLTKENLIAEWEYFADCISDMKKVLMRKEGKKWLVEIVALKKNRHARTILHFLLEDFGFSGAQLDSLMKNIRSGIVSGKIYDTKKFELTVHKSKLIISAKTRVIKNVTWYSQNELKQSDLFVVEKMRTFVVPSSNQMIIRISDLHFPVCFRTWKEGDRFYPFGMKGSKLLSDFFKDSGIGVTERRSKKILQNGNGDILWIPGYRTDERYRVEKEDKNLLSITLNEK